MNRENNETAIDRIIARRREDNRSINVHVKAKPEEDGVRSRSETICNTVRGNEAPVIEIEDLMEWPEIPKGAAILIEMPERAWQHPPSHYEEWDAITKKLHRTRAGHFYPVLVSEDAPDRVENTIDFRARINGEQTNWYQLQVDHFGGEQNEVSLDESQLDDDLQDEYVQEVDDAAIGDTLVFDEANDVVENKGRLFEYDASFQSENDPDHGISCPECGAGPLKRRKISTDPRGENKCSECGHVW